MRSVKLLFAIFFCTMLSLAAAQDKGGDKKKDWDVNEAHGPTSTVEFSTDEGTWLNLDVSPDGKEIVFDLLGDIYSMPISGGEAKTLTEGPAWDVQPRFSPDGKQISFTSDRAGGDNIWVMQRDGSKPKQITNESFRLLNNAVWTPDGKYLIARKHFTSTRSLGAGEMWMYHTSGGLSGIQLTKRKNDQQDAGEPAMSPDGKYLYFSEDMSGGQFFQYNKDPYGQIYVIRRLNMENNELENYITGPGGSIRPQPSPDGKQIAYTLRESETNFDLYLYSLAKGRSIALFTDEYRNVYPQWSPSGKEILFFSRHETNNTDDELYRMKLKNGRLMRLAHWPGHNFCPS